jgi:RNA-binding protein YhbY
MNEDHRDIETVARALCERQLLDMSVVAEKAAAGVDRYWHCVAAEIEAGLIDRAGKRLVPFNFQSTQEAYSNWRRRHPGGKAV